MKKFLFFLVALLATSIGANAQTIVKGDMNGDRRVTVADITSVVDVARGTKPMESISVSSLNPYEVDNSYVAGRWVAPDNTTLLLNPDGTTDYPNSATYEFMPSQGRLLFYDATGLPVKGLAVWRMTPEYMLLMDYATHDYTRYTSTSRITSIVLSESSFNLNAGSTYQLTATITPTDALIPTLAWTSSDENVATVSADGLVTAIAIGTCTITASSTDGGSATASCTLTVTQLVTSITLSQTSLVLELEDFKKLTATVQPENALNKRVTWTSSNDAVAEVNSIGLVSAIGYGRCTITCTAQDGSGVSATCAVLVPKPHEYVDLGLPSGTLWATTNVGANEPEEYGDYFAWGETEPKSTYDWSTYQYCNGSSTTLTKYCDKGDDADFGYNGFTDTLTELEPGDDAATVNWGSDWCMPSHAQFVELLDECTWRWRYSGQRGFEVVGPNGNILFLPAAGRRSITSLQEADDEGHYWSRSLKSGYSSCAYDLDFYSASWFWSYDYRSTGQSVRPVRASQ